MKTDDDVAADRHHQINDNGDANNADGNADGDLLDKSINKNNANIKISSLSPTSNSSCPACGLVNATFSNNQRKKAYADRKCKVCIDKQLLLQQKQQKEEQRQQKEKEPSSAKKKRRKRDKKKNGNKGSDDDSDGSEEDQSMPLCQLKDNKSEHGDHDGIDVNDSENEQLEDTPVGKRHTKSKKLIDESENELEDTPVGKQLSKSNKEHGSEGDELVDTPMGKEKDDGSMYDSENELVDTPMAKEKDGSKSDDVDNAENCWSPMQSEEEENELEYTPVGKLKSSKKQQNSNDEGNDEDESMEIDKDDASGLLEDTPIPRKKKAKQNVRAKMEMARMATLGRQPKRNRAFSEDVESHSDHSSEDDSKEEGGSTPRKKQQQSVEHLKQSILGRSISSMYDIDHAAEAAQSTQHASSSKLILDPSTLKDGTTVASHLRQELTCAICHDRLYEPVSLACGHSFCKGCLGWWLDRKKNEAGQRRDESDDNESGHDGEGADNTTVGGGTCPTCREPIPTTNNKTENKVNTALKAVMETLYGAEMNQRRLAAERQKVKAQSGERGGLHTRAHEEIEPLTVEKDELAFLRSVGKAGKDTNSRYDDEENGWMALYSSSSSSSRSGWQQGSSRYSRGSGPKIMIRRNIVLDDCDQRYQLSLGLTKCTYSKNSKNQKSNSSGSSQVLDIELCLLSMEEDEVDDSGFPTFVNEGDDDEALICTGSDRVHTCMEASVRIIAVSELEHENAKEVVRSVFGRPPVQNDESSGSAAASKVQEVPLSRGMIGRDGSVRFRIDLNKALANHQAENDDGDKCSEFQIVKLRFSHVDTGAVLELRLPSKHEMEDMQNDNDDGGSDCEIEFGNNTNKPLSVDEDENDPSRFFLDDHDEDEDHHDDEPNEYEEDGFLVNGSQDSEEEEDDDDDGECQICSNGGDLIVCDGGDHEGGCGHMYHVHCIGRNEVPPGDWICCACAKNLDMDVGVEGHEYEVEEEEENEKAVDEDVNQEHDEDDEEEIEEIIEVVEAAKSKPLTIDDSEEEEDEEIVPVQKKNKQPKRKIFDLLDSDESGSDEPEDGNVGGSKRMKNE